MMWDVKVRAFARWLDLAREPFTSVVTTMLYLRRAGISFSHVSRAQICSVALVGREERVLGAIELDLASGYEPYWGSARSPPATVRRDF
jgi:hypothetical protein